MICSVLLFGFLAVSAFTDIRRHLILNRTVYPGIVVALGTSGIGSLAGLAESTNGGLAWTRWGFVEFSQSLAGMLTCAGLLVVCYVCMPGQVGGGDVKLMAMIGGFLGLYAGLEVVLWTFLIAACFSIIRLIWQYGAWNLLQRTLRYLLALMRLGPAAEISPEDRASLQAPLYLTPSAIVAAVLVRFELLV
ncbi:MAG: prepilin peptidase [Planctomycetes bacterium]|nr:prepilin peptidase [Planctomycetota bacterium]